MILSGGQPVAAGRLDTLADSTPIFADGSYYANRSLALQGTWAAYGAIYRSQLWVGVVVRKLAAGTARLPFDIKEELGDNAQRPEAGPLSALLRRPQESLSGFKLWQWTSSTFDIYGEAFWIKERDQSGRVRGLRPVHPTNLIARRGENGLEWIYTTGLPNAPLLDPFPDEDIVKFTTYNPDNLHRGVSNLEGLRMTLLNEDAARRATASWWQRGARPSVALEHPAELSKAAQDRLRAAWESNHAGADLMGGTAILEEGMKANVIQLSAEEMQYIESRKLNREEVCAAYDVPPPVVHILDHATFSNITEQMRSQYRDTQAPRLEFFESVVDHQLVPDFYGVESSIFSKFNMDEVLRGDFEVRAEATNKLIGVGVMKPSEARPMFGLQKAGPEADVLYGNAALVPLGSSVHGQQEVDTSGNIIPSAMPMGAPKPPTPPPAKALLRSVMGRIGSVKAAGGDVRATLVEEHRKALTAYFEAQRDAAKNGERALDSEVWNARLASILSDLGAASAKAVGSGVAKSLGGAFDVSEVADWIERNAISSAKAINGKTVESLAAALDAAGFKSAVPVEDVIDEAFDSMISGRVESIASSRVAMVGGLASLNSAGQNGAATKTWVTGPKARSSHAQMNGETVPLGEAFSNGMNAPGDPTGGADEVAGCNCTLSYDGGDGASLEDSSDTASSLFDPEDLVSALDPARRRTAAAVRTELEKTAPGKDLAAVIKSFTETRGGVANLRSNVSKLADGSLSGAAEKRTRAFLDALNSYPTEKVPPLFRGFAVKVEADTNEWWDAFEAQFKVGEKFSLNASSFTSSEKKAAEFGRMIGGTRQAGRNYTQVRYVVEGDTHALPVEQLSKFKSEKEWMSGGEFEVVGYTAASKAQPYYRVVIRQIKSMEAPK